MRYLTIHSACGTILKSENGFWTSTVRSINHLDESGKTVHRYMIKNPSGFCLNHSFNEIGVLDTSGRLFLINIDKDTVQKMDNKERCECNRPILTESRMLWMQWDGTLRLYDFEKRELDTVAYLGKGVFVRGYTFDFQNNRVYVLCSYPPKQQTWLASVDAATGDMQIQGFPFRNPKELDKICIYNGNFLCLRKRHPALFLISSENFSVLKKIDLHAKLWTAYDFYWDESRKVVYIWNSTAVVKVEMQTLSLQTVWEDKYINDVSVAENGDVCIGTWEKGIVLTQNIK